jgi:type IV pilus assembly protein PilB
MRDGLVDKDELEEILQEQTDTRQQRLSGRRLGEILIQRGKVTPTQVARLVAEQYELPFVDFDVADMDLRVTQALGEDDARRFSALPVSRHSDGSYVLAMADPATVLFSDELRKLLGSVPRFVVVGPDAIERAIDVAYGNPGPTPLSEHVTETDAVLLSFPSASSLSFQEVTPTISHDPLAQTWPPLGALLVREGFLTDEELDAALAQQRLSPSLRLGEILVQKGVVTPSVVARLVAEQYELPFVDLDTMEVDPATAVLLPEEIARRLSAVPLRGRDDGSLEVAIADPTSAAYSDELQLALEIRLSFVVASPNAIRTVLDRVHRREAEIAVEEAEPETATVQPLVEPEQVVIEEPADEITPESSGDLPSVAFVLDAFAAPWDEEPALSEAFTEPEEIDETPPALEHPDFAVEPSGASVPEAPADDDADWRSRLQLVEQVVPDDELEASMPDVFELASLRAPEIRDVSDEPAAHAVEVPSVDPREDLGFELLRPSVPEAVDAAPQPQDEEEHQLGEVASPDLDLDLDLDLEPSEHEEPPADDETPAEVVDIASLTFDRALELVVSPPIEERNPQLAEPSDHEMEHASETEVPELSPEPEPAHIVELDIFGIASRRRIEEDEGVDVPPSAEDVALPLAAAPAGDDEYALETFALSSVWHLPLEEDALSDDPLPVEAVEAGAQDEEHEAVEEASEQEIALEREVELEGEFEHPTGIESVVADALAAGASTIHFSPQDGELAVRARVDGVVQDLGAASVEDRDAVVARLEAEGAIRTHVVTTSRGAKTTLFVRERAGAPTSIEGLTLDSEIASALRKALHRPDGAILVCGPAGSGTSTTLYALLTTIATSERIVTTIERPVERLLDGIDQIEVDPANGITFGSALQELRFTDTDAVVVGELVDREAADLALQAAYEGRLVAAGLRAPGSVEAIARLTGMGVEASLVAASLGCIVSQRLVRTVCPDCRETYYASEEELATLGQPESGSPRLLARGTGCSTCGGTGLHGRTGVFEVMPVTDEIRTLVADGASPKKIRKSAIASGMRTLREDAVRLCLDGVTSVSEVARALGDDS